MRRHVHTHEVEGDVGAHRRHKPQHEVEEVVLVRVVVQRHLVVRLVVDAQLHADYDQDHLVVTRWSANFYEKFAYHAGGVEQPQAKDGRDGLPHVQRVLEAPATACSRGLGGHVHLREHREEDQQETRVDGPEQERIPGCEKNQSNNDSLFLPHGDQLILHVGCFLGWYH